MSFVSDVAKGRDDIMNLLKDKAKEHKWYSFLLAEQIDYKEFKFLDREIEIIRIPGMFWSFRPYGKIKLTLLEQSPTETKIKCDVMTGNISVPSLIAIQTIILLLGSTLWIALGREVHMLVRVGVPIAVLAVFSGISILKIRRDKRSLIDYSKTILKLIKE